MMAYAEVLGVNLKCSTVVSRILPHFSKAFERCVWDNEEGRRRVKLCLDLNIIEQQQLVAMKEACNIRRLSTYEIDPSCYSASPLSIPVVLEDSLVFGQSWGIDSLPFLNHRVLPGS